MGRKSAPPPPMPDYQAIARQQAEAQTDLTNQQTWANRPTVNTPWGTQSWQASAGTDPSTGRPITQWTQNVSLSPQQQAALDSQMAVQTGLSQQAQNFLGRVGDTMNTAPNWGNLPQGGQVPQAGQLSTGAQPGQLVTNPGDAPQLRSQVGASGDYVSRAGDAAFAQARSRLDPQFAQQGADLESRLLSRGIARDSEAWNREVGNLDRARTDAYDTAQRSALQLAGSEAARMQGMDINAANLSQQDFGNMMALAAFGNQAQGQQFGQNQAAAQFGNQAQAQQFQQGLQGADLASRLRQQGISEMQMQRAQPLNELNALLSGQQVDNPSFPQFTNAAQGTAANQMQAEQLGYRGQLDSYNAMIGNQNARDSTAASNAAGLASLAFLAFSDRGIKRKIRAIGRTARGTTVYSYEINGKPQVGVIAQEAPREAVFNIGGVYAVDYSKV